MILTETIQWLPVVSELPDADITVLVFSVPEVGIGYLDGEQWCDINEEPIYGITHWAQLPEGPKPADGTDPVGLGEANGTDGEPGDIQ